MTEYLKEAEAIHADYKSRVRGAGIPFNDAVIAFLWLFARLMIDKKVTKK